MSVPLTMTRNGMVCNHCLRTFGTLHGGGGDGWLCCQCVQVMRMWNELADYGERRKSEYSQHYSLTAMREHGDRWCDAAATDEPWILPEHKSPYDFR